VAQRDMLFTENGGGAVTTRAIRMLAATATIKEYAAARAAEPSRDGTAGGTGSAILRGRRSAYSSAMNGYL
jgi:hypothetical protein